MSFSVRPADYQSRLAVKEAALKKQNKTKLSFSQNGQRISSQTKEEVRRMQGWTLLSSKVAWAGKPVQRVKKRASPSGEVPALWVSFFVKCKDHSEQSIVQQCLAFWPPDSRGTTCPCKRFDECRDSLDVHDPFPGSLFPLFSFA